MTDWRIRPAFESEDATVLVVESVTLVPAPSSGYCQLFAELEPMAVVVSRDGALEVLDLDGVAITLQELNTRCEGIRETLRAALA